MNVVDSSAWLEYFVDGPHATYFAKPIEDVEKLIVPTIIIYEVFKKVFNERGESAALKVVAQMKLGKVCNLDETIALNAARLSCLHKLPLADSIILATTQENRAVLWTQDEHFDKLQGVHFKPKMKSSS